MIEPFNEDFEIQGEKFKIKELTIDQSEDFLSFILKAYWDIDFEKITDPMELIQRAVKYASSNFKEFAFAIFKGQKPERIKWEKIRLVDGIKLVNFFFKVNKESVSELLSLFNSQGGSLVAEEVLETAKDSQPS